MIYKSLPSCIRIFPVGRDQFCKVTSPENTTRDVFRSRKFTLFYQEEFQIIPGQGQRGGQTRHSCSYNDTIEFVIHRSEERRVGKECRSLWPQSQQKTRL